MGNKGTEIHDGVGATSTGDPWSEHDYFERLWLALLIVFLVQLHV